MRYCTSTALSYPTAPSLFCLIDGLACLQRDLLFSSDSRVLRLWVIPCGSFGEGNLTYRASVKIVRIIVRCCSSVCALGLKILLISSSFSSL